MTRLHPRSTLFPYTTLFRSKLARERLIDAIEQAQQKRRATEIARREKARRRHSPRPAALKRRILEAKRKHGELRSEEHTSELQSHHDLVCRLLLEKKKKKRK